MLADLKTLAMVMMIIDYPLTALGKELPFWAVQTTRLISRTLIIWASRAPTMASSLTSNGASPIPRILRDGWVHEQVVTDLPSSQDISTAQQHLTKGSIRELHWHRVPSICVVLFPP
ncbi:hypothetical protein HD806DRAFT_395925 [Xylariaceae sp. AK1471]|nr:hypothetical protein HD806DRAFT_395925 [Xylariaceae sp. AK1471]